MEYVPALVTELGRTTPLGAAFGVHNFSLETLVHPQVLRLNLQTQRGMRRTFCRDTLRTAAYRAQRDFSGIRLQTRILRQHHRQGEGGECSRENRYGTGVA